jgi:hypothetical protein
MVVAAAERSILGPSGAPSSQQAKPRGDPDGAE